jgi:hypothetical protein
VALCANQLENQLDSRISHKITIDVIILTINEFHNHNAISKLKLMLKIHSQLQLTKVVNIAKHTAKIPQKSLT